MVKIDFERAKAYLREAGAIVEPDKVYIRIPDARQLIFDGIKSFVGDGATWVKEYDEVASWLTDNEGKGLLLMGNCGRGKSLLATKVLPLLINTCCRKMVSTYTAMQMNMKPDAGMSKHLICVDDIGTEGESMLYGNRRMVVAELADAAEREGKMLLLTTNMSVDELRQKYGERTIDRLRVVTKPILFNGESLRK